MSYLVFSEVRALQRRTDEAEAAMTSWKARFLGIDGSLHVHAQLMCDYALVYRRKSKM